MSKLKKYVKKSCSPHGDHSDFSCYDNNGLYELKKYWNLRHPDVKIDSEHPRDIWENLKMLMSDVCDNEMCWLRQKIVETKDNNDLLNYTFAPTHPSSWLKNKNEWLSSVDIEKVMKQYEKKNKNFVFIGPSPIDFDSKQLGECVWPELCNFNVQKLLEDDKRKVGMIFNTDPHFKSGEHWISMFLDLDKKFLFFFDSNGTPPSKEILNLRDKIINQCNELKINIKYDDNSNFSHQVTNTECGMFSLYFIINMLLEKLTPKYFKTKKISDSMMEGFRSIYFNS